MKKSELSTTSDLIRVVLEFIPDFSKKGRRMGRMATLDRIFQNLRITVN